MVKHEANGPLVIERGKGIYVYDDQGKEYIEGMAGLWCAGLGFSEPALVDAAVEQMRKLPYYHGFGHKTTAPVIALAETLESQNGKAAVRERMLQDGQNPGVR